MEDALGLAGRAGGIQDEKRIFRVQGRRFVLLCAAVEHGLIIFLTSGDFEAVALADMHDDMLDTAHAFHGLVRHGLQVDALAAPLRGGGRKDDFCLGILDAHAEGIGGETGEDNAVNRTDAGAGQNRDDLLDGERHVKGHAIPFLEAEAFEGIGHFLHAAQQFCVADPRFIAVFIIIDISGLFSFAIADVPVKAVVRNVQFGTGEPLYNSGNSIP